MSVESSGTKKSSKSKKSAKGVSEPSQGSFFFPDGSSYKAEYIVTKEGAKLRQGQGSYEAPLESYTGTWLNDKQDGEGVYKFNSGAVYSGSFKEGCFHGNGKFIFPDGATYEGEWSYNKMHGEGVYIDSQQVKWAGQYFNGMYDSGKSFVKVR